MRLRRNPPHTHQRNPLHMTEPCPTHRPRGLASGRSGLADPLWGPAAVQPSYGPRQARSTVRQKHQASMPRQRTPLARPHTPRPGSHRAMGGMYAPAGPPAGGGHPARRPAAFRGGGTRCRCEQPRRHYRCAAAHRKCAPPGGSDRRRSCPARPAARRSCARGGRGG